MLDIGNGMRNKMGNMVYIGNSWMIRISKMGAMVGIGNGKGNEMGDMGEFWNLMGNGVY